MASFNRVIVIGNLCRDPEMRKTNSGLTVVEFRLAITESYRNQTTNEKVERTCFIDVNAWNRQAEICQQYLFKGSPVFVEGRLAYDEWKTPQGETRSKIRIQAERVQLLGPNRPIPPPGVLGTPTTPVAYVPPTPSAGAPTPPPASMPMPDEPPF